MAREHDAATVDEQEREFRNGRPVTRVRSERADEDDVEED